MARKGRIAANLLAQRAAPSAPLARLFGSGSTKSALEWPKCWRIRSAADRRRTAPAAGEYALVRILIKLVRDFFGCLVVLAIGGRLHGHAAVQRADNVAQDQGGPAGDPDRGGAFQRPHPRAVPERDLSRLGCLRGRGGGADLLQQIARRIDPRRGGVPRGAAEGAQQLQSPPLSAPSESSPRLGSRPDRRGPRRARQGNPSRTRRT